MLLNLNYLDQLFINNNYGACYGKHSLFTTLTSNHFNTYKFNLLLHLIKILCNFIINFELSKQI